MDTTKTNGIEPCLPESLPLPFISVVIPTLNEGEYINQTLQQLHDQSYPKNRMEILVVDGGSTDKTLDVVGGWIDKTDLKVKILPNVKRISSSARNIGVNASEGDYVLFVDAHVFIPSNRLIEDMVYAAIKYNALVLGRPQPLTPPSLSNFQKIVAGVRASRFGHSTRSFIYSDVEGWVSPVSVGVMYHTSLFDEFGYFDECFDAAEDVEFNFRLECAGYKAYISPAFKVFYYPRKSFIGLIKQMFRYGVGRSRFTRKYMNSFWGELFVPLGVLCFCIVFIGCFLVNAFFVSCLFLTFSLYFFLFLVLFGKFSYITHKLLAPVVLFAIHLSLAVGIFAGFVECFVKRKLSGNTYHE